MSDQIRFCNWFWLVVDKVSSTDCHNNNYTVIKIILDLPLELLEAFDFSSMHPLC